MAALASDARPALQTHVPRPRPAAVHRKRLPRSSLRISIAPPILRWSSRALLGAAGALLLAVPQTAIWMLPIYKALGEETYAGTEGQTKGIYGLASSSVAALV
ncbi:hypothetical protein MVEN_00798900 [Mycena venus]|uniref:Uncharacterized protein n=1 Tax=Mycena venus TaxID=2733690 RepID=A0A8H7D622_9AGAR|nr:hypothetical protein MVEN_00798900 [Mycena venus]